MLSPYSILLFHGKSLFSLPIRLLSGSKYSHVSLTLPNNYIYEIDFLYSSRIRKCKYNSGDYDLYEIKNLTQENINKINEYIVKNIGVKYSLFENIRYLLYKWFKIKTHDDITRKNCLELILDGLDYAEIKITNEKYPIFENIISSNRLRVIK